MTFPVTAPLLGLGALMVVGPATGGLLAGAAAAARAAGAAGAEVVLRVRASVVSTGSVVPSWRRAAAASAHMAGESTAPPGPPPSRAVDTACITPVIKVRVATCAAGGTMNDWAAGGAVKDSAAAAIPLVTVLTTVDGTAIAALAADFGSDTVEFAAAVVAADTRLVGADAVAVYLRFLGFGLLAGVVSSLTGVASSSPLVCGPPELDTTTPGATSVLDCVGEPDPGSRRRRVSPGVVPLGVEGPAAGAGAGDRPVSVSAFCSDGSDGEVTLESVGVAHATPGNAATADPIPNATASPPTRPTYRLHPMEVPPTSFADLLRRRVFRSIVS